jgi:hypothetical protein
LGIFFTAGVAGDVEGAVVVELAENDAAGVGVVLLIHGGEGGDPRGCGELEVEGVAEDGEPRGNHEG